MPALDYTYEDPDARRDYACTVTYTVTPGYRATFDDPAEGPSVSVSDVVLHEVVVWNPGGRPKQGVVLYVLDERWMAWKELAQVWLRSEIENDAGFVDALEEAAAFGVAKK